MVYPTHTPYPTAEAVVAVPKAYPMQTVVPFAPYPAATAAVQQGKTVYAGPRKYAPTLAAAQQMTYDAYMQWLAAMPTPYVPVGVQQRRPAVTKAVVVAKQPAYTPVTKAVAVAKQPVLVQAPRRAKPVVAVTELPFLVPSVQGKGRPVALAKEYPQGTKYTVTV